MIVDASVAFKWIFMEEGSEAAQALLGRDNLKAPNLLLVELGNALWKKGMRGELGDRQAYAPQISIVSSFVSTQSEAGLIPRAIEMALSLQHAIYDCVYLALAEQMDETLVTADEKFWSKVSASEFRDHVQLLKSSASG